MLYAIMAHELGHIEHHDYQRNASSVTKELEADRFSGYTLSRMGIPRDNITPFYSLGGDEFSGVHDHGFSSQRIAAFDQGWKRAEWKQPENGVTAAANAGSGSLSDDWNDVEDPSTAAVP
jgi:predicted metalloprotease